MHRHFQKVKMQISDQALPKIGLGMAALGRPGYINIGRDEVFGNSDSRSLEKMQKQSDLVLDCLFQNSAGRPWIDCARSYGLSEKFVGEYLRMNKVKSNEVYCSSKWGYTYVADWNVKLDAGSPHEVKDHSVENFLKQIEETNEFLGEYVDLYQIHSATFESGVLDNEDLHKMLHKCRNDRGWTIGLSVSSPKQGEILKRAMKIEVDGQRLFDSVQCTFNCLEQHAGPSLLDAHRLGMDVIIKEGLANGRLLKNEVIIEYAKKLMCTPDALALGCILAQNFQPRVLCGAVTPEQLISNMKAVQVAEMLREDVTLLEQIMERCVMDSEAYWNDRSALEWN